MATRAFFSHATVDKNTVTRLAELLRESGVTVWTDNRELVGGANLAEDIKVAIDEYEYVIVLISNASLQSKWVTQEILHAKSKEKRIIPLLLGDTKPGVFEALLGYEPLYIPIQSGAAGPQEALPKILTALGLRLPIAPPPKPKEQDETAHPELLLELFLLKMSDKIVEDPRAAAHAKLSYLPGDGAPIEGDGFQFIDPLGSVPLDELRWYLESYALWPGEAFRPRAERVESTIQSWGKELYESTLAKDLGPLQAWQHAAADSRRISIKVDTKNFGVEGAQGLSERIGAKLLALPWELLHDGQRFLFLGAKATRIRRRLPVRVHREFVPVIPPIRILLLTARPESDACPYFDHRVSAEPVVRAMEDLGDLVHVTLVRQPTFKALINELDAAIGREEPYHVLHFDGHGIYSEEKKMGALCFEDPEHLNHVVSARAPDFVGTDRLGPALFDYNIPLVVLEACQSAQSTENIHGSVATALLEAGVGSVVAMSHTVLVETSRRFVTEFYAALANGSRVGDAMLRGQRELHLQPYRAQIFGAGNLELQDWFVPVLYQTSSDPVLFETHPNPRTAEELARIRRSSMGSLPPPPDTGFIGRSRELLSLQRILFPGPDNPGDQHWILVRGQGGEGKTALTTEFARWCVRAKFVKRCAFTSLESCPNEESVLLNIGVQIVDSNYSSAFDPDQKELIRALIEKPALLVIDNCESLESEFYHEHRDSILARCKALLQAAPSTRFVFTSREALAHPFTSARRHITLDRLSRNDAAQLIKCTLDLEKHTFPESRERKMEEEVTTLIEATQGHARTLSLLGPSLKQDGILATIESMRSLMTEMEAAFPGDREKSIDASIKLSLQRLPDEARDKCRPLAVFHGVVEAPVLDQMTDWGISAVNQLGEILIDIGLATRASESVFQLHPGLCPYLLHYLDEKGLRRWRPPWLEATRAYVRSLLKSHVSQPKITAELTLLALPNLAALLDEYPASCKPTATINLCSDLHQILRNLGQPRIMAQIAEVLESASGKLGEAWSHEKFESMRVLCEQQMETGDLQAAQETSAALLHLTKRAAPRAYEGSNMDCARAEYQLGRILLRCGIPVQSLRHLQQALIELETVPAASASPLSAACHGELGRCNLILGQYEEAAASYEAGIETSRVLNDDRNVAVGMGNLGTARIYQKKYDEALFALKEALQTFETLKEPGSVAVVWNQIGMVQRVSGNFEEAEDAYRESLKISIVENNLAGQASTYNELGILFAACDRLEDAAESYRRAATLYTELENVPTEGICRGNLAHILVQLEQFSEARREIKRSLEIKAVDSQGSQAWTSWKVLHDLEQTDPEGDHEEATRALRKAQTLFFEYRRNGGENEGGHSQFCSEISRFLNSGDTEAARSLFNSYPEEVTKTWNAGFLDAVKAIIGGQRNASLNVGLEYMDTVEIQLLLESLTADVAD